LGFVIVLAKTAKITKLFFSLIPQINLFLCFCCIFHLENFETMSWDKLWLKANRVSYMESVLIYIFDIIFYLGLSVLIQSYKDSGLEFFDYINSFFMNVSRKTNTTDSHQQLNEFEKLSNPKFETHHQELSPINKQKLEQNNCLRIINVSKNFDEVQAVNNFKGELFSNEIFCLLGHNGAGKTTLVNMISGIYDPNQGDILFNGRSLVTNKKYLYENIGLCQQEDIYFDYLTVKEHLEYMCRIKGSKINKKEIDELIKKIELEPKKDALCSTLSGGQKRKLCIALALIGGSQIILLDEPTSGMDVLARRKLWEFLKVYKKDKILLITTHYLDEAEYLGDRIGIMSDGEYLCSGTSSFLKSKYPCGFNLNFLINPEKFSDDNKERFFDGIKKYDPKAEIRIASKGIFTINIQSYNKNIPEIFDFIEQKKVEYGIDDYTVSSTSLEDVFLKINNKANLSDIKYIKKDVIKIKREIDEGNSELENNNLLENNSQLKNINISIKTSSFMSQLFAQVKRGFYPLSRNKILFIFELLSGLGFVYIFIFFFSDFIIHATTVKLSLLDVLNEHRLYFYEKNTKNNFLKNSFAYELKETIPFVELSREPKNIIDFMNLSYEEAFVNIAKGCLYVDNTNSELINVYNTEIDTNLNGYFYANTMLFVSAFLKNNYNINAVILHEIEMNALSDNGILESIWNFLKDFIVLIIVCLISLFGFVIFLGGLMFEKIREKRNNIKHLLYLSGSNMWSYWLGFFIVDYIKLIFYNIFLMLPIFTVSGVGIYFGLDMLSISLSSLSFIYFISFFCNKEDEGAKILFIFVFGFLIIITALSIMYPTQLYKYSSSFTELYKLNVMDLTPVTSMGLSFLRLIISFTFWDVADKTAVLFKDFFNFDLKLKQIHGFYRPKYYLFTNYIAQTVNFIFYSLLLILAESGYLGKIIHKIELYLINITRSYASEEKASEEFISNNNNLISPLVEKNPNNEIKKDDIIIKGDGKNKKNSSKDPLNNIYVQKEKEKVNNNKDLSTKISKLRKTFFVCCGKNVRAINDLYLGLEPNEKFGLLGFNGSGKTTIFRALTNEILTDSGTVNLFGYDNQRQFKYIRTMVGYCPQINPLFDFMKVKEIIKFYSELKTSPESVEMVCAKFGLSKYLNTYTINLSGGNKRKLTFAIAMMNKPTLLLLDEPSTGVDPESRRIMWRNINELSNSGHQYNMILTTHSMEEAEILCDTVSWLKAGNFVCVGNPEELKLEYSAGYKLHIKFNDKEINKQIMNAKIEEAYNNIKELVDGFDIFDNIILNNKSVCIENYLNGLIKIVGKIKDKTKRIVINEIGKDMSFELVIEIIKEKQKELFSEILNMKNVNKEIDEMSISMQCLENILTSLN
jgi:ATP-binding cassette subfamily A (ABC1) protein 3